MGTFARRWGGRIKMNFEKYVLLKLKNLKTKKVTCHKCDSKQQRALLIDYFEKRNYEVLNWNQYLMNQKKLELKTKIKLLNQMIEVYKIFLKKKNLKF